MAIELGIPLLALLSMFRIEKPARTALSILGATTPFLALYLACSVTYLFDDSARWAFHAMWLMTLVPFLIATVIGFLMSFWKWPSSSLARYGASLVGSLVGMGVLIGIGSVL